MAKHRGERPRLLASAMNIALIPCLIAAVSQFDEPMPRAPGEVQVELLDCAVGGNDHTRAAAEPACRAER
jgi:hypothetical protein